MRNHRLVYALGILMVAVMILGPACATKKYVNGELAQVDKKVSNVSTEVETAQKRIQEHDEKLTTIGELINKHDSQFKQVDGEIANVKSMIRGTLVMKETIRNNNAKFAFNSYELSPEAKSTIDSFVQRLISENKGVYIEIQGHTDNTGSDDVNLPLGQKRAQAVMMYLYKTHHIPLHRMAVVSLGSSVPVADNSSRDGRAQNRRVEVLVYE